MYATKHYMYDLLNFYYIQSADSITIRLGHNSELTTDCSDR